MYKIITVVVALFIVSSIFVSCQKEDNLSVEDQFSIDTQLIEEYLKANNLVAEKTVDGIYYIIENAGSAEKPTIINEVIMKYSGYFTDGLIFDNSKSESVPLRLYNTIVGWQKGIPKFGKGGKGKLFIPSKFGYGTNNRPGRANAVLIFDIELLDFN